MFHFVEASVIDVDEIWGKGDSFTGEIGEQMECGNRAMEDCTVKFCEYIGSAIVV
jgi:hypothetical protein